MEYHSLEELLPRSGHSIYRLVRMAAMRAMEISDGHPCLIKNPVSNKATTMALEEIAQGKIEMKGIIHPAVPQGEVALN